MQRSKHTRRNQSMPVSMASSQRGVALLMVLLMVVTITVLATTLIAKQHHTSRETNILLRQDQALQFLLAGEMFASALLSADQKANKTDSPLDLWAKPTPPFPIQDGYITTVIEDRSGRFNLNNLFHDGKVDDVQVAYFQRLLGNLGLSAEIAEAVIDWQDPDNETTGSGGAEAEFYLSQNKDVVVANQPFKHVNELRQVRGVDTEAFQALKPLVFVAPNFSTINVNTAPAAVLAALGEKLTSEQVTGWADARNNANPVEKSESFFDISPFSGIPDKLRKQLLPLLSTQSTYFDVRVRVNLTGRTSYLTSILMRGEDEKVVAYQRNLLPFVMDVKKKDTKQQP